MTPPPTKPFMNSNDNVSNYENIIKQNKVQQPAKSHWIERYEQYVDNNDLETDEKDNEESEDSISDLSDNNSDNEESAHYDLENLAPIVNAKKVNTKSRRG